MKKLFVVIFAAVSILIHAQQPIIIDHSYDDLSEIPLEWVDSAKAKLFIGYGHTSHGSQITSGMNAIESYFTDGTYDWSHSGGENELHLFEGSSYSDGYLDHDVGYTGWDDLTRTYLDSFPECNVIIWSWCGQVNDRDLQTHYFDRMNALEHDYPDVKFVYMTGHLEGGGPDGSLFQANQSIRDFCDTNNKILFDFADIEKYGPDADTNYQEYFCNDECNYDLPQGGTANWANNWLTNNPDHELTQISAHCGGCAHSVSLNCVKKGIAAWYLWAILAGWEYNGVSIEDTSTTPTDTTVTPIDTTTIPTDTATIPPDTTTLPTDTISNPMDTTDIPADSTDITDTSTTITDTTGSIGDTTSSNLDSNQTYIQLNNFSDKILVYPNPFTNELNLEFKYEINDVAIEILTMHGKLLYRKVYKNPENKICISDLQLQKGVYLLNIKTKNNRYSVKLLK
ncbi:T9SS type A sorting domain-containing protein [Bacteroidota bacterium]